MEIINGQTYRIKGASRYFKKKYGTSNPDFCVEGTDRAVCGKSWADLNGNPAAMLFGRRSGFDNLPWGGTVYYGHIGGLGEFVHETELEPKEAPHA